ncbi:MAG: S9 family peptidase [Chloroflexi bacterium]|nr:MAG: S9 family peptidase [Chloroflexota bacterium]
MPETLSPLSSPSLSPAPSRLPASTLRVESLLSARLFVAPEAAGDHLYFASDLSGRLSLYRMRLGGSVPEPLLPPHLAVQNPHLIEGEGVFCVLPTLHKVLVMLDRDGDENYQPVTVPLEGGIPQPLFGDRFAGQQVVCLWCDRSHGRAVFSSDPRTDPTLRVFAVDLAAGDELPLASSIYSVDCFDVSDDFSRFLLAEGYSTGDVTLLLAARGQPDLQVLYGTRMAARTPEMSVPLSGFGSGQFTADGGILLTTALFEDTYGLGYLRPETPGEIVPVPIDGLQHQGVGELEEVKRAAGDRYTLRYNIDGCSWLYEGGFDAAQRRFTVTRTLCGVGALRSGVMESVQVDTASGRYALSFSTATSPSQLYVLEPGGQVQMQTNERILGIPPSLLSPGEDASFTSHDGLRVSARLYLPAAELGYAGPRPVVFYIHGGPQGQERPDFTWFSMPLIQYLTLRGFAVFVPNARGSTGYGLRYVKHVDHDWGGQDRLDHVHAAQLLRQDPRLDMDRAAVVGRSYGGFMTLTLAGRHPSLWRAAVDMFGPYNLLTFVERLPEAWKTYFYMVIGHPERDRDELIARSPSTYLGELACPLLVIQGANDPRVVERESRDVVEQLRGQGKMVDYLVFENEGHDVLKFENKVRCYTAIADFFARYLHPKQ